ncbi:hypothetical protein EV426DRAFT_711074 [Tirmania nivea]|nr:hypothetical protein EV426DRAFT_711074 [Tirmania nivea]
MSREEDGHEMYPNEPKVANSKGVCKEYISWERFYQLDKDVGILNVKMDTVQRSVKDVIADVKDVKADVKEVAKKVDRLLYFIIGGIILKGGFDLFRDERGWKRSKEN